MLKLGDLAGDPGAEKEGDEAGDETADAGIEDAALPAASATESATDEGDTVPREVSESIAGVVKTGDVTDPVDESELPESERTNLGEIGNPADKAAVAAVEDADKEAILIDSSSVTVQTPQVASSRSRPPQLTPGEVGAEDVSSKFDRDESESCEDEEEKGEFKLFKEIRTVPPPLLRVFPGDIIRTPAMPTLAGERGDPSDTRNGDKVEDAKPVDVAPAPFVLEVEEEENEVVFA